MTATVSPAFTPSGISTQVPWRAPGLTSRSTALPLATTNTLVMPASRVTASPGTKTARGVLAHEDVALGEEAGPQRALGVGHAAPRR